MGRIFLEHLGGDRVVLCGECDTPLTNKDNFESNAYQGSSGKAYLYKKAVNLKFSNIQERIMMTGLHFVRDVYCKICVKRLGWMYEFALPEEQRFKEGKVILEKSYIKEQRTTK